MRLEYVPREMIDLANVHLDNNPQFISRTEQKKDGAEREGGKKVFKE